jgi:6-phosphogluconolactonase
MRFVSKVLSACVVGSVVLAAPVRAEFAYVSNVHDSTISAYSVGVDGALTQISGSPFTTPNEPGPMVFDPAGRFIYVACDLNLEGYSIDSKGNLTLVANLALTAGHSIYAMAVDPGGQYLYGADYDSQILAFRIGSNGALTHIGLTKTASSLNSLAIDPEVNVLYAAEGGDFGDYVAAYSIGSDGSLQLLNSYPAAETPQIAVDPRGGFVLTANFKGHSISVYQIGSGGYLTPVAGSPFAAQHSPDQIIVGKKPQFVYVNSGTKNLVSGYKLHSDGSLTQVPGSPFATGTAPVGLAFDSTETFLYVTNYGSASVSAYSVDSDGGLTAVPGSPFAAGVLPQAIVVTP